jgi:predicted phosphodiesterase
MTMSPTAHILMTLEVQGSAQCEIAKTLSAKAPGADVLISGHLHTARLYELLHRAVGDGLLTDLEARYGA